MSRISTHILDTARGLPAAGVAVVLEQAGPDGAWTELGCTTTDANGRISDLCPGNPCPPGDYRIRFATAAYFHSLGQVAFYPEVLVQVRLDGASDRYHLPLLLSPYGYSTYRGS